MNTFAQPLYLCKFVEIFTYELVYKSSQCKSKDLRVQEAKAGWLVVFGVTAL